MRRRAVALATLALATTALGLRPARARETRPNQLDDDAAPTMGAGRLDLALPAFEPGLAERLSIGADPPAWSARLPEALPVERHAEPRLPPSPEATPPERPKHFVVGVLQTGLLLGGGTFWYWSNGPRSRTSDLRFDLESWKRKVDGTAVRFDDDRFETNSASHPTAGLGYFQVARGNGFSYAQSYLWAFASSFLWEYLVEWNENPSINDLIMTPAAGVVVGESTFRLGRFFAAGEPTIANRLGALLLSPFAELDDLATGRRRPSEGPYDALGFTTVMRHGLALSVDRLSCSIDGHQSDQTAMGFDSSIVTHRGYRRPGRSAATVGPGQWTELSAHVFFDRDVGVVEGLTVHSSTLVLGRYLRRYAPRDPSETWRTARPNGVGLLFGLGSAFDYRTRQLDAGLDKVVSAGLLGPTAELTAERGWFGARAALSSTYSFAMVQSLAYMLNGDPLSGLTINTALHNQGYYYGHGVSSVGSVALRLGDVELGVAADFGAYWSINGHDRYQERLQADLSASDQRASRVASVSYRPWGTPVLVAGRVESIRRTGQLPGSAASSQESRAGIGAGLVF